MSFISLKQKDVFSVTNQYGDMDPSQIGSGIYYKDTRYLKTYKMSMNGSNSIFLARRKENWGLNEFVLSNGDMSFEDAQYEKMDLEIHRSQFIYNHFFYDEVEIKNGSQKKIQLHVELELEASFDDIFEVRGAKRTQRGQVTVSKLSDSALTYRYSGLDQVQRELEVSCSDGGVAEASCISFDFTLKPGERKELRITLGVKHAGMKVPELNMEQAKAAAKKEWEQWLGTATRFTTDNASVNRTLEQGLADLYMLTTDIGSGDFPVAGVPWFCVPFGRDSILCALQSLIVNPGLAINTLRTLASLQGTKLDASSDEAPGKILHEMRDGEMANLKEVPFGRYYGSVDSTPLFLILLSETYRWTGDMAFLREMLPYAEKALEYLDRYADLDGDGYIEFDKQSENGLDIQSWKDSKPSMVHKDGAPSFSPMAVVEVQGYLYDAKLRMAEVLEVLNQPERAAGLTSEAEQLQRKFNLDFWMEKDGYYALALDREKQKVATITSDPGHGLWSGIIDKDKSQHVADVLLAEGLFSGWGIRTMSKNERVYSPLSYHNGAVWPHDNSIIALGLAKYGYKDHVRRLVHALFDTASRFEDHRLPELFCGYDRVGDDLIPYPVACSPQAWAAGTPFACMQSLLGLRVDSVSRTIAINPVLPENIGRLELSELHIGGGSLHVRVWRDGASCRVEVDNHTGYVIHTAEVIQV